MTFDDNVVLHFRLFSARLVPRRADEEPVMVVKVFCPFDTCLCSRSWQKLVCHLQPLDGLESINLTFQLNCCVLECIYRIVWNIQMDPRLRNRFSITTTTTTTTNLMNDSNLINE
jgi:hypothetical protein